MTKAFHLPKGFIIIRKMRAIICEMCNGRDFAKTDEFYVCQSCGTRFSLEQAKKLMVEIDGAVKIDNSDFVQRYLLNARRAMSKEDWSETEKYYNMVEQNEPSNIEAIFYSAYAKAKVSLVDSDIYKRAATFTTLKNSISILDDNFDVEKHEELNPLMAQIVQDIFKMRNSAFVYNIHNHGHHIVTSDRKKTIILFDQLIEAMQETLANIVKKFKPEQGAASLSARRLLLQVLEYRANNMPYTRWWNKSEIHLEKRAILWAKCANTVAGIQKITHNIQSKDYDAMLREYHTKKERTKKRRKALVIALLAFWLVIGIIIILLG